MKKRLFHALSVILCICLLAVNAGSAIADEAQSAARAQAKAALEEAQKEKEELESALADAEALVSSLKDSKADTESAVASLNSQLAAISAEIASLESQLSDLDGQIDSANEELASAQDLAEEQYAAMKARIKYIYENGNRNYLTQILSSEDMASFLNAIEYVSMMNTYDRTMLEEYKANIAYQEEIKAQLEDEYDTAKAMQESIGIQKQTVSVLKSAKTDELTQIGEDLSAAEEEAEMYAAEVKAQEEILSAIQAQIAAMDYGSDYISSGIFCWPCPSYKYVSSDYGPRTAPTTGASTTHKGIDIAAGYGSAILAAEAGVVTTASYSSSSGNYIIINHGSDSSGNIICTVYMHCSALYVSEGDVVARGQSIAAVGSTGISTGNHLHFGVTVNGSYTSPWNYVSKP